MALGLTRYWKADDGRRLDAGAFVRALEYAADDVVMVGDDIRSDVEGAQRSGLTGVLVRTGKFTPADLDGDVTPDAVLDSIADFPDWAAD